MRCRPLALVLFLLLAALPAQAQDLRTKIRDLFRFGTCGEFICLVTTPGDHQQHFKPDADANGTALINFLGNGISQAVSNVPIAATSSGAVFTFDAAGLPVVSTGSAGPIFGERSQTLGRKRLLVGVNYSGGSFQSVRGIKLTDLRLTLTHEDTPPAGLGDPTFEFDTIHVGTHMSASFQSADLYFSYGVTNKLDVSVAVPLVNVSFNGSSIGTIVNADNPPDHFWKFAQGGVPQLIDTASSSGSATGLGDIAARVKYNFYQTATTGAAVLADVRLPTGRSADLLGTGNTQVGVLAIASTRSGAVEPHVNAGYVYRSGDTQNSAVLTTLGVDALVAKSVTLAADVIGQWQVGASKLTLPPPAHFIDGSVVSRTNIPGKRDDVIAGSFGGKVEIARAFTAIGNVLIPFSDGGVKTNVTWTVGLQRTF